MNHGLQPVPIINPVTGRFGGDLFRRQFFAESSINFLTFQQNLVPVSAKYDGRFDEIILDE